MVFYGFVDARHLDLHRSSPIPPPEDESITDAVVCIAGNEEAIGGTPLPVDYTLSKQPALLDIHTNVLPTNQALPPPYQPNPYPEFLFPPFPQPSRETLFSHPYTKPLSTLLLQS